MSDDPPAIPRDLTPEELASLRADKKELHRQFDARQAAKKAVAEKTAKQASA